MRVEVHGVLQVVHLQVVDDGRTLEGERRRSEGHAVAAARDVRRDVEHPAERLRRLGVGVLDVQVQVGTGRHHVQLARVDTVHELHGAERRALVVPRVVHAVLVVVPRPDGDEAAVVEDEAGRRLPVGDEAGEDDRRTAVARVVAGVGRTRVRLTCISRSVGGSGVGHRWLSAEVRRQTLRLRWKPPAAIPVVGVRAEALKDRHDTSVIAAVETERDVCREAAVVVDDACDVQLRSRTFIHRATSSARTSRSGRGRCTTCSTSASRGRCTTCTTRITCRGGTGRRSRTACATGTSVRGVDPANLAIHDIADQHVPVGTGAGRERLRIAVVARKAARTERVRIGAAIELASREVLVVPAEAWVRADGAEVATVEVRRALRVELVRGTIATARGEGNSRRRQNDSEKRESIRRILAHGKTTFSSAYRGSDVNIESRHMPRPSLCQALRSLALKDVLT